MSAAVEELAQTVPVKIACEGLGVPRSTLYRQRKGQSGDMSQAAARHSARKLSDEEKKQVHELLNSERFRDLSPYQVYAILLDEGEYHCSISTMYRILREHDEVKERRHQRPQRDYVRPELLATAPNQVWSWDITWLKGPEKWQHFYLYVIIDIYSRYVVGWMLAEQESGELAEQLIRESCRKQEIERDQLIIHADRGAAMTSQTVAQLLEELGVGKSHTRPYTSDDNPYSEAQFKTLKYRPDYPERFADYTHGKSWAEATFDWYNNHHRHSGIGLLTPAGVHYGKAEAQTAGRQAVLEAAYEKHPERFVRGKPQAPRLPEAIWINAPVNQGTAKTAVKEQPPAAQAGSRANEVRAERPLTQTSSGGEYATAGLVTEEPSLRL